MTYVIISLIALLDISGMYFKNYFVYQDHTYFDFILEELVHVFNALLCYLILKLKIFKHHLLGIVLVFIGYFLSNAQEFTDIAVDIIVIIEGVIIGFAFSILEILGKYIMDSKYINPYRLLFFQGLFGIIFLSIICGIANIIVLFNSDISFITSIKTEFDNVLVIFNDAGTFFICIAYMFLSALVNIGVVLTNYYYTPISRIMVDCNTLFFSWLIEVIKGLENEVGFVIMEVFGFFFLGVGGLVYHEITVFHFLGLSWYTKSEITKRGKQDIEQTVFEFGNIDITVELEDDLDDIVHENNHQ